MRYQREDFLECKELLLKGKVIPLTVGQRVLAVHPKTGELKTGSILTSEGSKFDVRFDNPDLGIGLIKDYNLIPIGDKVEAPQSIPMELPPEPKGGSYLARQRMMLAKSAPAEEGLKLIASGQTSYFDITYTSMALLISLLEKKNVLLKYLRKWEAEADSKTIATKEFKEKLAWIGVHLKLTNTIIDEAVNIFRLRNVKEDKQKEDAPAKGELYDLGDNFVKCIKDYETDEEEKDEDAGKGKLQGLVGSFMNILKNFQQFYEVYTDGLIIDWKGKEQIRKKLAQQCYEINVKYIQKQLESIREKVTEGNIGIYKAVEGQVKNILAKYSI